MSDEAITLINEYTFEEVLELPAIESKIGKYTITYPNLSILRYEAEELFAVLVEFVVTDEMARQDFMLFVKPHDAKAMKEIHKILDILLAMKVTVRNKRGIAGGGCMIVSGYEQIDDKIGDKIIIHLCDRQASAIRDWYKTWCSGATKLSYHDIAKVIAMSIISEKYPSTEM